MRPGVTIVIALVVGAVLGVVITRTGAGTGLDGTDLLTQPRAWLIGVAVLAALASGPVVGALTGLAAMFGLLGALEVLPWNPDVPPALRDVAGEIGRVFDDTTWIDLPLLAGAAVVGAAVGTIRWALRVGRRLLLVAIAVAVVVAVVAGVPELDDVPFSQDPEITIIR